MSFNALGVSPDLVKTLDALGLTEPTPIQKQAIPAGIEGKDVIGIAQTGTGKTLAFGIPLIQKVVAEDAFGLILVPTRELALQVDESLRKIGTPVGVRTAVLIGGASMGPQVSALQRGPRIVIATPGRLIDHLQQGTIRLTSVSLLVLDEADRMLDMGFWPQIRKIIVEVPKERQTFLFSATLSREIRELAGAHMRVPLQIEVAPAGTTAERVTQEFFIVRREEKSRLLEKLLGEYRGSTIVFLRTKHGARKLMRAVQGMGHTAAELHGNRSLSQRKEALQGFKDGRYRILVATDIAARGIDVKGVDLVINYDMPTQTEDYVHRIGRTARAGAEGHAITFAQPEEKGALRAIERLIRKPIPLSTLPELPPARALAPESASESAFRPQRKRTGSFGSRPPYRGAAASRGPGRAGRGGRRPASGGRSAGRGSW